MAVHLFVPLEDQGYSLLSTDPLTNRCMVFVHGFFGDMWSTWEQFQDLLDLPLIDADRIWSKTDVYFFDYGAEKDLVNQSAQSLSRFLDGIYQPHSPLFNLHEWLPTLRDSSPPLPYSQLVLIGHSLGAVVVRQCIVNALRLCKLEPEQENAQWLAGCELRLFAPAHRGFVPSSLKALLFRFANWVPLLSSLPLIYPAYGELQPNSTLLQDLKKRTEALADENPGLKCLRAQILYGRREDVVCPGDFDCDYPPEIENGVGHAEVCKPSLGYLRPLVFVTNALHERTTAS